MASLPPTVLIVDDEPAIVRSLRAFLEQAGYVVRAALEVDTALDTISQTKVDAVVLDLRMPDPSGRGRSGFDVLRFLRLHGHLAKLPVLVLTGAILTEEQEATIHESGAELYHKPQAYPDLVRQLDRLTGRSRRQ